MKAEPRLEGQAQAQEKAEAEKAEEKRLCPRCGQPYSYVDSYRRGGQVYYVAVHYEGYEKAEAEGRKRIKKKVKKCYLGPQTYKYVEKLHDLDLAGAIDRERFKRYFKELLDEVDLSPRELIAMIEELSQRLLEELDLTEADKDLADRLKGCYQLLLKAYGKATTRLLEARLSSKTS